MPIPTYPPLVPFGICPDCGGYLVERENKINGSKFIGCSKYPTCHYVEREDDEVEDQWNEELLHQIRHLRDDL